MHYGWSELNYRTPLQCTLVPRVDYTTIRDTLMKQKEFIQARIRERSSSHRVRLGLPQFQEGQPPTTLDYKDILGLRTKSSLAVRFYLP